MLIAELVPTAIFNAPKPQFGAKRKQPSKPK
jgi:hypothetical protein